MITLKNDTKHRKRDQGLENGVKKGVTQLKVNRGKNNENIVPRKGNGDRYPSLDSKSSIRFEIG